MINSVHSNKLIIYINLKSALSAHFNIIRAILSSNEEFNNSVVTVS